MIRHLKETDYQTIISVVNDWWNGRKMDHMLPMLFFTHFQNTSFVIEEQDEIVGFIIGFVSQSQQNEAYIHFVGVHPQYRELGIAKKLYEQFFTTVKQHGCQIVKCITSPVNTNSIAFHQKMGFQIEETDTLMEGIYVKRNYDGQGNNRVLFYKSLY
ncbi:GNAT family N-acetyltransferase [Cytobacillus sp. IB215665]|uniref:GNAT family N-acetyltransferase n=1 Tax=Cytobacillus sp. IB215665 TaxID=3097357 RepID=UPI002A0E457F|nr:GNAT family N-acetyltransferase [Cytobacillus sp. IB215665]MDX8364569.1 GNAT family N-acetyltransferase [Cytobacillus sp. IB215665]